MTLLLSKDDKVFLNFDNGPDTLLAYRPKILQEMEKRYNIEFTDAELLEFKKYPSSIGVPIMKMKDFLDTKDNKVRTAMETGIPIDSTDNQLADWIFCTCLLYTSDAADEEDSVDLGGRRIIKKKKKKINKT